MRGGFRAGAGRPRGAKTARLPAPATTEAGESPLDFLLGVMRDEAQATETRMRAAGMALPYTTPKPAQPAAKDKRQAEAEHAERGTDWDALLNPTPGRA